ncbi:MAG: HPr family phosphocarrier protein [Phycisphaeraceae bacterium]
MPASSVKVTITNKLGLHARPAMAFADAAAQFESDIYVVKSGNRFDGKSIMNLMMLAATQGTELEIAAEGPDADAALAALQKLVASNFDEEA